MWYNGSIPDRHYVDVLATRALALSSAADVPNMGE
jgi:hypothetical protein